MLFEVLQYGWTLVAFTTLTWFVYIMYKAIRG